ncbi:hypothetical protein Zmor_023759 [Zophobas morio]|uniref:Uncharacterized protein n=1 Tax=Zophobas morio TaxID=2755281 RepID=A0AA38M6P6_9CUCU|nr:hypothetical protein Zmor_023759 [Zophobas morio]
MCNDEGETAEYILRERPALASYRKSMLGAIWPGMAKIREFPPSALFKKLAGLTSRSRNTLIWTGEGTMGPKARPKCRSAPIFIIQNPECWICFIVF